MVNYLGYSPLYYAVMKNSIMFVKYLLEHKADPNQKCYQGNTPVHLAFQKKNLIVLLFSIMFNTLLDYKVPFEIWR